jgi:hypothetical protein
LAPYPWKEDSPRHSGDNFYYVQEDLLADAAKQNGWRVNEVRSGHNDPPAVLLRRIGEEVLLDVVEVVSGMAGRVLFPSPMRRSKTAGGSL